MLRFASRSDRRLWNAVKEWKATAITTFRALETGQEAPGSYFEDHAWYNGEREGILELFRACTVELTQEASVLGLNPRPLQEAFDVVSSWDPEHNAGRIPDRGRFRVTLRSALVILGMIEEGVRSRAVKERRTPESGLTSIVPVATYGKHEGNGVVIEPVATKATAGNPGPSADPGIIPPERRSRILGKSEAARFMGRNGSGEARATWLKREVDAGRKHWIEQGKTTCIIDLNDVLPEYQDRARPEKHG